MKTNKILLIFFILAFSVICHAQEKFKFGDVPKDLLEMTVYEKDSAASALIIYENQNVNYAWNEGYSDFELVSEYVVRIKILTADGVDQANVSIPFYKGPSSATSEKITGLTGWTYNLENGKVVKEKLLNDYVFTENITENFRQMKFALPAVKTGSVIEYKYIIRSPFYYYPKDFLFQRSIPVKYSFAKITIPEYLIFNRERKGYEPIKTTMTGINMNFVVSGGVHHCTGEEFTAEVFDLPALKDESFVWNYNDFMTGITFDLRRIVVRGVYNKDYTQSWANVVDGLYDNDDFGRKLKNKDLFKNELSGLQSSNGDDEEKIRAILNLVRRKIKWNECNTLYITDPSKALKEGVGTSGEINSILFNALKNAGYNTRVIVMSLRSNGRIPMTYPSRDNFNYFIVQVKSGEKMYYLDATRSYCDLNVIPPDCLVDKALCIVENRFDWVDLSRIGNNTLKTNLVVSFNEDGVLSGRKSEVRAGECIYTFKQDYESSKDEEEYIHNLEIKNDISISDYLIDEKKALSAESYNFTSNTIRIQGENLITISPLLFETMRNNPFKKEERKLPVEFNYPEDNRISVVFSIPEGYVLDEVPKSEHFMYGDENEIDFSYLVQVYENNVQIAYRLKIETCIVPAGEYEVLRNFFSKIYAKCQEVLIFKKK